MKKNLLKSITLCLIIILFSCKTEPESKIDKPEKIGKQVFSIVKSMQNQTKEEYLKNLIEIEELRNFVSNNPKVKNEFKNELTSLTKDEYYTTLKKEYQKIKKNAIDYGIQFSQISYLDFTYKLSEEKGLKTCEGFLHFKHNGNKYSIKSISFYLGKHYGLMGIGELKQE